MATLHHNITGELTQELLAAGNDVVMSSISLANTVDSGTAEGVYVDLFIKKALVGKYYFFKKLFIPASVSLIYNASFNNTEGEFGLYIKLTKSASETPIVDVIIS